MFENYTQGVAGGGFRFIFINMIFDWFFTSSMGCAHKSQVLLLVSGRSLVELIHFWGQPRTKYTPRVFGTAGKPEMRRKTYQKPHFYHREQIKQSPVEDLCFFSDI